MELSERAFFSAPAAVSRRSEFINLEGVGVDNGVYNNWWNGAAGGDWRDWQALDGRIMSNIRNS